jgi:hypothetical protein
VTTFIAGFATDKSNAEFDGARSHMPLPVIRQWVVVYVDEEPFMHYKPKRRQEELEQQAAEAAEEALDPAPGMSIIVLPATEFIVGTTVNRL